MAEKIIIDDGRKTYEICNKAGDVIGQFTFNPADAGMLTRYKEVQTSLDNLGAGIDENADIEKMTIEMTEKVKEQINYLFNDDIADDFFKITSPFSLMANGEFFLATVLNAIAGLIEAETGERVKKVQAKIGKHVKKYHG